jgi:hypothetical protein
MSVITIRFYRRTPGLREANIGRAIVNFDESRVFRPSGLKTLNSLHYAITRNTGLPTNKSWQT